MSLRIKDKSGNVLAEVSVGPQGPAVELFSPAGTRAAAIAVGADYGVPSYVVGSGRLQVWLDGVLCRRGPDAATAQYAEAGDAGAASTRIRWHIAIPKTFDITVRVA